VFSVGGRGGGLRPSSVTSLVIFGLDVCSCVVMRLWGYS